MRSWRIQYSLDRIDFNYPVGTNTLHPPQFNNRSLGVSAWR